MHWLDRVFQHDLKQRKNASGIQENSFLFQTRTRIQHLQDQNRAIQQGTAEFTAFNNDENKSLDATSLVDDQFSSRATVSFRKQMAG